jgi:hypothetical protein
LEVEFSFQLRKPAIGKFTAPRFQRFSDAMPIVEAIHMERTIAFVGAHLSTARAEELANPEVSPERIQFDFSSHVVHITSEHAKSMD